MRILRLRSPRNFNAILLALLLACFWAVLGKPLETRSLAAPTTEARTGKASHLKSSNVILKEDQTITFQSPSPKTFGDPPFQASATASSGLEVTMTAAGHCNVNGLMVHLTGVGSCTLTATQVGDDDYNAATSLSRSFFIGNAGETVVDVTAFGATGDGTTDDAPAFQQALNALADAGGGTVFVPPGRYALATPVTKTFTGLASSIAIRGVESETVVDPTGEGFELAQGLGLSSEIYPRTNEQSALSIFGLKDLLVADIAFVGTPEVETDALATLNIHEVDDATIHHCEFYGLRTLVAGAGIVFAYRSGLRIEQSKFLGSFGLSSTYTSNVQNLEWKSIAITDVVFLDYGLRPELYCKCDWAATYAWVNIGNAAATTADSPRREASFQNVFLDEGGLAGLSSIPSFYSPPSAPIDLVYISGLHMNVANLGTTGNYLSGLQNVLIENSRYGWSQNASSAIELLGPSNAIIDQVECVDGANRIVADSATQKLTVINSAYAYLDSQAQVTKTLTVSPEDDPVQYVRAQFVQALGRAPDPAAHFYWSDLLLQCDEDAQCVADRRALLAGYLSSGPSPTFSLGGQIKDENGASLSGVVLTLAGSQSATTQSDGAGRYLFANLPTSGVYTITPSLVHYAFAVPNATFTTPAGDQAVDFDALHNRYLISGRVVIGADLPLAGATVTLSGSESGIGTTDALGNYSFEVTAEGNYTVTPAKDHHTFNPVNISFDNLAVNADANFTATTLNYILSGKVVENGIGLNGVLVTLSGSQSGSITTDSSGNYAFTVPAEGDYTVTLSRSHYTFSPAQSSYSNLGGSAAADFIASLNRHTVSGQVTNATGGALPNVTLTLSGSQTATATSNQSGAYSFVDLPAGGNYVITPSQTDKIFSPANQAVTDLGSNQNFDFKGLPAKYTISGNVTVGSTPLTGVVMTLSGSQSATATTDSGGAYSFQVNNGGSVTITPSLAHYAFSPLNQIINNVDSNQTVNFAGTNNPHSISGRVRNSNNYGIQGVTVTLTGGQSGSATTDANGNFVFPNLAGGGNYTVTPSLIYYAFTPASKSYSALDSDQFLDIVADLATYQISGRVIEKGIGLGGVTIDLTGSHPTLGPQVSRVITGADGLYSFSVPAAGNYAVVPSKKDYGFSPSRYDFSSLSGNRSADFNGSVKTIQFSSAMYTVSEATADLVVNVTRSGDTTAASSVKFSTYDSAGLQDCNVVNGIASPRCDYSFTVSTVQFAPGETSKTVSIAIIDGAYAEGNETFSIRLTDPSGAVLGAQSTAVVTVTDNDVVNGPNPVTNTDFFIRQHYLDFLGREPDPAGYEGWRNVLNNCGITVPQPCDRTEVSSAFFRSPEFQGRGYFVYRFYSSVGKVPLYDQFAPDLATLSGFLTAEQLEANKVAFTNEFMNRPDFRSKYDALSTPGAYVDGLLQTVGLPSHPSRQSWIDGLTSGSLTRAQVLRALIDSSEMYQKYYNEAFVVMQYFGYLRRTADASYLQWIQTMNSNGGDYRVMVSGFLDSLEYRRRFGP